jgi:hypothetical protein
MIELSKLPAQHRERLQSILDRLPADAREQLLAKLDILPTPMLVKLLEHGSPMMDRLIERLDQRGPASGKPSATPSSSSKASAFTPAKKLSDHYNKTVQRGDNLSVRTLVVVVILSGIVILLYRSGMLGS